MDRYGRPDARMYQPNDPYRAVRKPPSPDSSESTGIPMDSDFMHSRTASDSSTSRLATGVSESAKNQGDVYNNYDYYDQDPYAVPARGHQKRQHRKRKDEGQRANSYLPYSHHRRNPYGAHEPVYLEEERLPSFISPDRDGPVGSILQDNIIMDTVDHLDPIDETQKSHQLLEPLPSGKKKRRWCGLRRRTIVYVAFVFIVIVAVIWYFVWPRVPTLQFLDADLREEPPAKGPPPNFEVHLKWNISMTTDNSENWVPTHIKALTVEVFDDNTQEKIGTGSSGPLVLAAKKSQTIPMNIDIDYGPKRQATDTYNDLLGACYISKQSTVPEDQENLKQQKLNVIFRVTYHIAGFAWTTTASVKPANGFACPTK
ncbi:uncharacterized protein BYT42DRAFT_560229 [Radiomyces spectabilis]|uniref:uncharacterized protein n=1 Tax=Radiomyces spectabilis TaxID=64574 RepID=UPI002220FC5E|nr:uncharacterized protein BYT42DRAFT_560229 [Radiomyces spectabilis]KAI8388481.1 hypothetical protein BYT42DRAFT_560229 [Radiomyces spectabilis]